MEIAVPEQLRACRFNFRCDTEMVEDHSLKSSQLMKGLIAEKCYRACRVLHVEHRPDVPYSMFAKVLGVAKVTVRSHCKQHRVSAAFPGSNGGPPILSHAERDDLVQCITTGYAERRPWTITEIKDRIESSHRKRMAVNYIRHVLRRDLCVKACHGVPMEETRLAVSPDDIKADFHRFVGVVDGSPAHFAFEGILWEIIWSPIVRLAARWL
jgi:hypothetical protein